jgi:hypothetical protein
LGGCHRFVPNDSNPLQEKFQPAFEITIHPDRVQETIVLRTMPLEVEAQIEKGLCQQLPVLEEQRDQKTTDAAVPVKVGVNGLEFYSAPVI